MQGPGVMRRDWWLSVLLALTFLVIAVTGLACSNDATGPSSSRPPAITCSLVLQGEQPSGNNWLVSWRYSFSGVSSASFTSEPFPATDNLQLFSSPGFVTSTHPRRTVAGTASFTFAITLRAGTCVDTEHFTN